MGTPQSGPRLHPYAPVCRPPPHSLASRGSEVLEAKLRAWTAGLLCGSPAPEGPPEAIAIEGKTLRGSRQQRAPGAHLRSALAHRLGLTLAQHPVADATNEIPEVLALLRSLVLEGRVVTMDAWLTQRQMAQRIIEAHGDCVMLVKANPPHLREDIHTVFALPPIAGERRTVAETVDSGHGRIEQRRLRTRTVLVGDSDGPGLAQVLQIERQVMVKKTGEYREEVVAGVTSLGPESAKAARLLALVRGHWQIEHQSHWVRDVTFDEERSQGGVAISRRGWRPCAIPLLA